MAKLTREDILNLARLARLHLSEDEIVRFQKEVSAILEYATQLQNVDVDRIEPTYQVTGLHTVTRPDEIIDYGLDKESLLKNVPRTEKGYIKVRRML
jgi:aspartyl-tRNA(Asn)/glutamyl-tRNA(Gln) amidotransferase subunit C